MEPLPHCHPSVSPSSRPPPLPSPPLTPSFQSTHTHTKNVCSGVATEVRVQVSNVTYSWEGVVGNTGPSTGPNVMSSLTPPLDLVSHRGLLFLAMGYNEGQTGLKMIRAGAAAAPHTPLGAEGWWQMWHPDSTSVFTHIACDGERVFAANAGECGLPANPPGPPSPPKPGPTQCTGAWGTAPQSFVVALEMQGRDFCEHNFTAGDGFVGVCRHDPTRFGCSPTQTMTRNNCNGGGNEW